MGERSGWERERGEGRMKKKVGRVGWSRGGILHAGTIKRFAYKNIFFACGSLKDPYVKIRSIFVDSNTYDSPAIYWGARTEKFFYVVVPFAAQPSLGRI